MEKEQSQFNKISVAMIVKDETSNLAACLASIKDHVDEIVVAWNGTNKDTKDILESYSCKIVPYKWIDDFSDARTFSFEHTSNELVMWLDADDTVLQPEKIKELLQAFKADPRVGAIWLPYYYDFDEYGHPTMILYRERIVRKSMWEWKGRIHEVMLPKQSVLHVREDSVIIKHSIDKDRVQRSAERNLRISEKAYKKEHQDGDVDPKTVYDYGRSLKATGNREDALKVLKEFVELSQFDDDRYEALHSIADIYRKFRWWDSSIDAEFSAMRMCPQRPEAYFGLAETYFCLDEWDKVIWFTDLGYKCPPRDDNMPVDPIANQARPLMPLHMAYFQKGKFKEAFTVVQKALEYFPKNEFLKNCYRNYSKAIEQEELEQSCMHIFNHLSQDGESHKLEPFSKSLPDFVMDHPVFVKLQNKYRASESWKNKIVIYCGSSHELWDPRFVKDGLGGSEEAVVNIAPLLAKQGWEVEVYNNCAQEGNYDGATWKPFWTYDQTQPCAIFIAWRDSRSALLAPQEAKVMMWLHDKQKKDHWSPEMLDRVDKFFFLSEYHRKDLPEIPDEKIFITSNGIRTSQFIIPEPRDPLRCFYASSPDRGLDVLLEMWPKIMEKVPEAELHTYYGFTKTYDQLHAKNQGMKEFREQILKDLKKPGVTDHGRIGHEELSKEFLKSSFWLYPTYFTEISCITAMKAQAAGAIPITMTMAALDETVQHGIKIPYDIRHARAKQFFVKETVKFLLDQKRAEEIRKPMMSWAKDKFDWSNVAHQWNELFRKEVAEDALVGSKVLS